MGKAWSLRRSLLVCRHGRTVQERPAVGHLPAGTCNGEQMPAPGCFTGGEDGAYTMLLCETLKTMAGLGKARDFG
jgi:hypothetical protein